MLDSETESARQRMVSVLMERAPELLNAANIMPAVDFMKILVVKFGVKMPDESERMASVYGRIADAIGASS